MFNLAYSILYYNNNIESRIQGNTIMHLDTLGRPLYYHMPYCEEQYLEPSTRRLVDLRAQCAYTYYPRPSRSWIMTSVCNTSPYLIRLSEWTLARQNIDGQNQTDHSRAMVRWLPGCFALWIIVSI